MDELEFESRLSNRLHRRFDGLAPSPELRGAVHQVLSTSPRPTGLAVLRTRRGALGWGAVVAAGLIAAIALSDGRFSGPFGPGAPSMPPGSPDPVSTWRDFIVLPPAGYDPDKADSTLASAVLMERMRALLFTGESQGFSSGGGYGISFSLPRVGPSDDSIRAVLRAPGVVSFVPLAETDDGVIGQSPPAGEPALFGAEAIAGASIRVDEENRPVLSITLRPAAADAFRIYTDGHVGSRFAIVIDDDIALLPTVSEPITDGTIEVAGGGAQGSADRARFLESAAIIVGGKLPDAWIVPTVPDVLSPSTIERALEVEFGKQEPAPSTVELTITDASLSSIREGRRVVAVWYLQIDGLTVACPSPLPSDERGICRSPGPAVEHVFDAESGEWLGTAADFDESQ